MPGWIIKVRKQHPQHAQIALQQGLWDMERAPAITAGDDVFFLVGCGVGLAGHAVARGTPRPLQPGEARPWAEDDSTAYAYRVPLRPVRSTVTQPVSWRELQGQTGLRGIAQAPYNEVPDSGLPYIRGLFTPVDVSLPTDDVELEALDFAPHLDRRTRVAKEIAVRRGQKAFRNALLTAYGEACAVTGCTIPDVLEAAHISPYRGDHTNDVRNGLLLRADIHTLFDLYRLTVGADDFVVRVHPSLQSSEYAGYAGQRLRASVAPSSVPDVGMLRQHNKECRWLSEVAAG